MFFENFFCYTDNPVLGATIMNGVKELWAKVTSVLEQLTLMLLVANFAYPK